MTIYLRNIALTVLLFFIGIPMFAQGILPKPVNITRAYQKGTRSNTGKPGAKYWQNTASYHIKADFNPKTRLIKGTVAIDYVNNSPDTLTQLLFKLYPNLYKKGVGRDSTFLAEDLSDGVEISSMLIDNKTKDLKKIHIAGTNMPVTDTVLPGKTVHCVIDYSYTFKQNIAFAHRAG